MNIDCAILFFITVYFATCASQQFNRANTGVIFSPYVKLPWVNGGPTPNYNDYSTEEVRVMLEVTMEKFSKITTWDAGSHNVPYIQNVTYYKNSDIGAYVAETAALINRDLGKKNITIIQGIWGYDEPQQETEVKLAIECAEKANKIFPGTVEGLIFSETIDVSQPNASHSILEYLKFVRNSVPVHLKLGTNMICKNLMPNYDNDEVDKEGLEILKNILKMSDFVVCTVYPEDRVKKDGPAVAFQSITREILAFRAELRKNYTNLDVMVVTEWASAGPHEWENVKNMKAYWELAEQWASRNNFSIWLTEAFNNPWKAATSDRNLGWWRLTDNLKSKQRAGYVEKVSEIFDTSTITNTAVSSYFFVGTILGLLIMFFLVLSITVLSLRVRRLEQQLTKQDIREFREGMSNEIAAQQNDHNIDTSAFKIPYDNSYEIKKDQLKIQKDTVLGMGQFGCVFKAEIESSTEASKHVALKMARNGCPRSALKGLLSEIKIMIFIGKHSNIVEFCGAYTAELYHGIVYIATEFCGLGSLEGFLREHSKCLRVAGSASIADPLLNVETELSNSVYLNNMEHITLQHMLKWSQEIACGMDYLGTKNVVHADLATRNVLLTLDMMAKISDFGLSRRMYNYLNYVKTEQEPLPWRWMAIESLKISEFSVKSDVWSYGVTLWEIFTLGATPFSGLSWTTEFVTMLENGLRMTCPSHVSPELYDLMVDCWKPVPEERPNFAGILTIIGNILGKNGESGNSSGDEFTVNLNGV